MSKLEKMIEWKEKLTIIPSPFGMFGEESRIEYLSPFALEVYLGDSVIQDNPRIEKVDKKLASILEELLESRQYGEYLLHKDRKVRDFTRRLIKLD